MTFTLTQIGTECSRRLQLPLLSTIVGSTDNNTLFLLSMIEKAINEIKDEFIWPELTRRATITLVDAQAEYALPADYDRRLSETLWNTTQRWPLLGPADAVYWETLKSGLVTTLPRQRFRVFGYDPPYFVIDPTPTASEAGQTVIYEYISAFPIKTGASTYAEKFAADTDTCLLDPWMIIDGTVWRYKRERGQDYEDLRADALRQLEDTKAKLIGAGVLTTNSYRMNSPMIGVWSYPEGNY